MEVAVKAPEQREERKKRTRGGRRDRITAGCLETLGLRSIAAKKKKRVWKRAYCVAREYLC